MHDTICFCMKVEPQLKRSDTGVKEIGNNVHIFPRAQNTHEPPGNENYYVIWFEVLDFSGNVSAERYSLSMSVWAQMQCEPIGVSFLRCRILTRRHTIWLARGCCRLIGEMNGCDLCKMHAVTDLILIHVQWWNASSYSSISRIRENRGDNRNGCAYCSWIIQLITSDIASLLQSPHIHIAITPSSG